MSDPAPPSRANRSSSPAPVASSSAPKRPLRDVVTGDSTSTSLAANGASSASNDTASHYGTRSRNRAGGARPNYAEDKDMDMDMFVMYPERREDELKKPDSSRKFGSSGASSGGLATNGAASSISPALDKEARRPINGAANSNSERERLRKPLPSSSAIASDASTSHQNGVSNSRSGVSSQSRQDREQSQSGPVPSANGSGQSSSTSRKRKAAIASEKSGSSNGNATGAANTSSAPLLNISLKKSSAAVAAAAAAAAAQSPHHGNHRGYGNTNLMTFEKCGAKPNKAGQLVADDGSILSKNEPYYIGRVMEFLHPKNNTSMPVDALRVNWYYRPRDIGRKAQDTRSIFATMHSDTTPLTALRGKCTILHKAEIPSLDLFRKEPDSFWFDKLYDRYIQKNYEVIPTFQIVNVPERVKKVLHERWRYILIEQGPCSRAQERLLEARHTPNLIDGRTPDAAAAAAATAAADEDELLDEDDEDGGAEACRTSSDNEDAHPPATDEQQYQASLWPYRYLGIHCKVEDALDYDDRIYPRAATRVGPRHQAVVLPWPGRPVEYVVPPDIKKATRREARQNKEAFAAYERERDSRPKWIQDMPAGYVERGQDYPDDDERNTAYLLYKSPSAPPCVPPVEKAAASGSKMDIDPPELAHTDIAKDTKKGTVSTIGDDAIDSYMKTAVAKAAKLGVPKLSTNLHDVAADLLYHNDYDTDKALKALDRKKADEFKEPLLNASEQKRFEEAVTKFGSELYLVTRAVKTVFYGDIVRYYYAWKKSNRGKIVWGNNTSRKGKKEAKEAKKAEAAAANKIQEDVADDMDDSAFDTDKAVELKRQFQCKFCGTKASRQWRRAPAAVPTGVLAESLAGGNSRSSNRDRSQNQNTQQFVAALCRRCSEIWRRYAVQWEDVESLLTKAANAGGRMVKRKLDEELMKEIAAADDMIRLTELHHTAQQALPSEPPRKRHKGQSVVTAEKDTDHAASDSASSSTHPAPPSTSRRRDREKVNAERTDKSTASRSGANSNGSTPVAIASAPASSHAPAIELLPEPKKLPCAVCLQMDLETGNQRVVCRDCRLTVHRSCYGVLDNRNPLKWLCDMCTNDRSPHMSINYNCVLCPVEHTAHETTAEASRSASRKKSEKDRERDRIEREQAHKAAEHYRKRQEELNKPAYPREALKRTADNNWVHVTCAVWTPEIKFGKARALEPSEGVASVPRTRYDETCKICKSEKNGACVACHQCKAQFHVGCAHQAGHIFGFDLVPVKSSRRDQANIVTINGVSGNLVAAIWCQDHVPLKNSVLLMHQPVDNAGLTALQFYAENYKQAGLTLTGCARKANLLSLAFKMTGSLVAGTNSASWTGSSTSIDQNATPGSNGSNSRQGSYLHGDSSLKALAASKTTGDSNKICLACGGNVSPKWYAIDKKQERELANGYHGKMGEEVQRFVAQHNYQCHKCKKADRRSILHDHDRDWHEVRQPQSAPDRELSRDQVDELALQIKGPSPAPHIGPDESSVQQSPHHQHKDDGTRGHKLLVVDGSAISARDAELHNSHPTAKNEEEMHANEVQRLTPRYAPESDVNRASQPEQQRLPPLTNTFEQPPATMELQPQHTSQPQHRLLLHPVDHARAESSRPPPYASHAQQMSTPVPASPHSQTSGGPPPGFVGSSRSPPEMGHRYWATSGLSSSAAAPPTAPPLPHQAAAPLTTIRPTSSRGTPSPHVIHSVPHTQHHSPQSMPVPTRSSIAQQAPPPPSQPVHPYHGPSQSTSYSDWRRPSSTQAPPSLPPNRREPYSSPSGGMPPPITHNHLRPPPLSGLPYSASGSMANGGRDSSGYVSQGSMSSNRPLSPPRRGINIGPPPPLLPHERASRTSSIQLDRGPPPPGLMHERTPLANDRGREPYRSAYGSSHSPHVQNKSPHNPFAQLLHPQRSSSSSYVTREDFTLRGGERPPPSNSNNSNNKNLSTRPADSRNGGSSASSNASLRNLLS
ncbi:putative PHD type zinc finger protein with BAH domain-containing protein [Sporothrix epigloea]|uniref:PHD type zinc finger protein with BAH domain-containing protein n=1 Tax=Sporothrix epigloea TaxID=1892477 RepID=A0ABP0DG64_9PEZI